MDGPLEPSPLSSQQPEHNWTPIILGIAFVVIAVGIVAWFERAQPTPAVPPPPYAASLKLSDFKIDSAQNFIGATVTYLDGTITNAGNQTVTHMIVHVVFPDANNHPAQVQDVPLQVLQTAAPSPEAVDLQASPLAPGQSKSFRLTFEHVSGDWNRAYPQLRISQVTAS